MGWNEAGSPIKSILPALIGPTTNMKSDVVLLSPLQEARHEGWALADWGVHIKASCVMGREDICPVEGMFNYAVSHSLNHAATSDHPMYHGPLFHLYKVRETLET